MNTAGRENSTRSRPSSTTSHRKARMNSKATVKALSGKPARSGRWRVLASVGEEEGKAFSERLERVRAATKEYTSAAALKKLAQARHGVSLGTVRPPLTPVAADCDPGPTLQLAETARM
jgi:hypothetical protein